MRMPCTISRRYEFSLSDQHNRGHQSVRRPWVRITTIRGRCQRPWEAVLSVQIIAVSVELEAASQAIWSGTGPTRKHRRRPHPPLAAPAAAHCPCHLGVSVGIDRCRCDWRRRRKPHERARSAAVAQVGFKPRAKATVPHGSGARVSPVGPVGPLGPTASYRSGPVARPDQ